MRTAVPRQHARSHRLTRTFACTDEMAAESTPPCGAPGSSRPSELYTCLLHGTLYK
jgi:hypothetical protein